MEVYGPNDLVSLLIQIMEDSWIMLKYERSVCVHALYMNASIVFISWKVEARVKEPNTINNIDNNVIKKVLTMMSIMIFEIFRLIRFKIACNQ